MNDPPHKPQPPRSKVEEETAAEVYDRYLARLLPLVRRRMSPALQRRVDAEDVVQSALRSFFVRDRERPYPVEGSVDLWRLLAAISLSKLRKQVEWHTAGKRAMAREEANRDADDQTRRFRQRQVSSDEAAGLLEEVQSALDELPSAPLAVIQQFLSGEPIESISADTGKSPRTVRRWLQEFRENLEQRLQQFESSAQDPRAPLLWSDYLLKQHIGSGTFGKVYRAVQKSHNRTVAIKALRKEWQRDPEAAEHFVREAQLLVKVGHPAIVGVHGLGQYPGGGYFLVLDWIDGEDLQRRIERGLPSVAEAVRVTLHVGAAVQHAHRRGVIHGDLKPSNVIVSRQGSVVLTDFGLAWLSGSRDRARGGTLAYMAPELPTEQAADGRVDVYGLGALLYALLTGIPPRTGSAAEILQELSSGRLPNKLPLQKAGVPRDLVAVIERSLHPVPEKRYATIEALLTAIRRTPPL